MTTKLTPIATDYPIDRALCVFKSSNNDFFLGFLEWDKRIRPIKMYSRNIFYNIDEVTGYQYVLNENGGFLFVNESKK